MTITLTSPVNIDTAFGTLTISALYVRELVDRQSARQVLVTFTSGASKMLWMGDEYDAVGQWTDANAEARIAELALNEDWVRSIVV